MSTPLKPPLRGTMARALVPGTTSGVIRLALLAGLRCPDLVPWLLRPCLF
jgi:hypothetical protein